MTTNKKNWLLISMFVFLVILIFVFVSYIYQYKKKQISGCIDDAAIEKINKELAIINKSPDNEKLNKSNYPQAVGIYCENGKKLIKDFYCDDLCPDYNAIYLLFEGSAGVDDCKKFDGHVVRGGWGIIGCSPLAQDSN